MSFDQYSMPMGEHITSEKRYHSPDEIRTYVQEVEKAFGLPSGGISQKRTARKKRSEGGLSIVEIRKAAILHLLDKTTTPKKQIVKLFGISRPQLFDSFKQGQRHRDCRDETFSYYYGIVTSIEI
jgi:hypothetical protein